jgi:hypothetical protein
LGHTGSWTYKETAEAKANDSLTLDFVWVDQTQGNWGQGGNQSPGWKETGRSFSFDHYTKSITEFFQSDNGWVNGNDSDAVPSTTGTKSHVLSVDTFAERKIVLKGTPKDYSFTINQNYADSKSEMRTHDWSITIAGESGRTKSYTENTLAVLENHTGINKNGIVTESNFESVRYLENFLKFNTHIETPNTIWDTTKRRYSEMFLRREGNPQNWNGFATFKGESVDYWERIDKIKGKKTSYLSPPNYYEITRYLYSSDFPNATTSPDFWNIYLEDIKNSSPFPKVVQWVIQNWDNLQRIGVGLLDVAGGITLTLDSCGLGIIPGVGLMVVGLDQIVTGVANWGSEIKAPSVFEYLGYSGAKTLGFSEGTSQVIGSITPAALSLAFSGLGAYLTACFAAGTQLLTPEGSKAIEEFKVGDLLLSRNENWFEGPVVAKVVEEVFVRTAQIMELRVGGRVIKTTGAHPFYVAGKGWQAAEILEVGEELSTHNGWWMKVEEIHHSGKYEPVYNLRVADFHTYFVGAREWGFSVWAHNQCMPSARFTHNEYVQRVRPGARERTFYPGGRNSRGLGSRRYDDFDHVTRTAFEGNTTPWSQMTAEKLQAKLHQVGSDILLLNDPKRAVRRVIWFGTEPLPTSGLGGQLLQALQQAGIPYWFVP